MSVAVVFTWRPGCPHRERSFGFVRDSLRRQYPHMEQVIGESPEGPFNRSAAMLDGAAKTDADVLVFHDTDVDLLGPLLPAIDAARTDGWAVPHRLLHRLSQESSDAYMAGASLDGLGLDQSHARDRKPYIGYAGGTLVVVSRDALNTAPPDPRFVGWGQEDEAWALALSVLVGKPWRGTADLVHLWHPPAERKSRSVGNHNNLALLNRYQRAARNADAMRALVAA